MLEPPFVVHRDQRADGVEVVTSVPMEDFFKMQAMSDQLAAATLAGSAEAKAMAEGIIQKALSERPELRGYSVVMGYLLKNSLERASAARQMGQQPAQQPWTQPQQAQAQQDPAAPGYAAQQVGSAPGGPSGGTWAVGASPVGGGGGGGGGARGIAATAVQGARTYSRVKSGGSAARASGGGGGGGGGGRGTAPKNAKRQAGGFKTYARVTSHQPSPSVASVQAPSADASSGVGDPWAAAKAQTAAVLASRGGAFVPQTSIVVVDSEESGGEE